MDRRVFARQILQQVTDEFHTWAQEDAAKTFVQINSGGVNHLQASSEGPVSQSMVNKLADSFDHGISIPLADAPTSSNQVGTSKATVWNASNESTETLEFPRFVCEMVQPVPAYESWTPIKSNIWRDPGFNELPYVPYADESSFPAESYTDMFHNYQDVRDVDGVCRSRLLAMSDDG
jgi:hypothetical protein